MSTKKGSAYTIIFWAFFIGACLGGFTMIMFAGLMTG